MIKYSKELIEQHTEQLVKELTVGQMYEVVDCIPGQYLRLLKQDGIIIRISTIDFTRYSRANASMTNRVVPDKILVLAENLINIYIL